MRGLTAAVLALSLIAGDAIAAETGALAPGNAAGVNQAQMSGHTTFYVIAFSALLVGGVSFLISTDHGQDNPTVFSSNAATGTSVNSPSTVTTSTQ